MKHDYRIVGPSYSLRPVENSDVKLICELRGNPELNQYIHSTEIDEDNQKRWLQDYYNRENDFYFVIIDNKSLSSCGLISAYNVSAFECEWGRWIIKQGSMCALESAWLIYSFCFDYLSVAEVYCRTVSINESVVAFHNSMKISLSRTIPAHFDIDGDKLDAIEHRVTKEDWKELSEPIVAKLKRLALYT